MYKLTNATIGDIVIMRDGATYEIDGVKMLDGIAQYYSRSDEMHSVSIRADHPDISTIVYDHPVADIELFDKYYLEATEYLATARRFVHDNASDGAAENLVALKTMVKLLSEVVDRIDSDQ